MKAVQLFHFIFVPISVTVFSSFYVNGQETSTFINLKIIMIFQMAHKKRTLPLSLFLILATYSYSCCDSNTLSVVGAASVQVAPDIATFTIQASAVGKTSVVALSLMNDIIKQATKVLQNGGAANYTTSRINLNSKYDYNFNPSALVGQQATQTLIITVDNITSNKNKLAQLTTSLGSLSNITLSGLSFENSDTSLAYRQARLGATKDARTKAAQYASLSGRKLGSIRNVVDLNSESYTPFKIAAADYSLRAQLVSLPSVQTQVTSNVKVVWSLLN